MIPDSQETPERPGPTMVEAFAKLAESLGLVQRETRWQRLRRVITTARFSLVDLAIISAIGAVIRHFTGWGS